MSLRRRGKLWKLLPGLDDRGLGLDVVSPGVRGGEADVQLQGQQLPGAGPQGDAAVQVLRQQPPQPLIVLNQHFIIIAEFLILILAVSEGLQQCLNVLPLLHPAALGRHSVSLLEVIGDMAGGRRHGG